MATALAKTKSDGPPKKSKPATGKRASAPSTLPIQGDLPPNFNQEALSGGPPALGWGSLSFEETEFDRKVFEVGLFRLVNLMLADPKVGGTIDTIKTSILADGIDITPCILPKFGGDSEDEYDDEDAKNAFEVGQFVARCLDRLIAPLPVESTLWQLLDSMLFGVKLGEMIFAVAEDGIDEGKIILDKVKIKHQLAWRFALDQFGNVQGIGGANIRGTPPLGGRGVQGESSGMSGPGGSTLHLLPREKFVIMTWNPHDDDPRGRTILRRVYGPWYDKFQTRIRYNKYLSKFAAPSWVGSVGPDEQPRAIKDPKTGRITTADTTPVQDLLAALIAMEDCSALALAHGGTAKPEFPDGNGEAFLTALAYQDKQIVSAILLASRATEEAQFGSRADSESAQDTVGTVVRHGKTSLGRVIRQDVARMLVLLNYGKDWSDKYTPFVSLGKTEHMDFSRNAGAIAKLTAAGFFDESQRPGLCSFLGMPLPKPRKDGTAPMLGQIAPVDPNKPGGASAKPGSPPKDAAGKPSK